MQLQRLRTRHSIAYLRLVSTRASVHLPRRALSAMASSLPPWEGLGCGPVPEAELCLDLTLPTGQSFRYVTPYLHRAHALPGTRSYRAADEDAYIGCQPPVSEPLPHTELTLSRNTPRACPLSLCPHST